MAKDKEKLQNIKHYCYLITNLTNDKVYVGTTYKDINIRFGEHIKVSNFSNYSKKQAIHKAIFKHRINNFKIELLSEFENALKAYEAEVEYIKKYKSRNKKYGYNQSMGGDCGPIMIKYNRKTIINILTDFCDNIPLKTISLKYNISYHSVFDITRLKISITHKLPSKLLNKLKDKKLSSNKRKRLIKSDIVNVIIGFLDGATMQQLAEKRQLSINNIWNIVHRNTWKNIDIGNEKENQLLEKLSADKYWKRK
jgi:hypothetical protein